MSGTPASAGWTHNMSLERSASQAHTIGPLHTQHNPWYILEVSFQTQVSLPVQGTNPNTASARVSSPQNSGLSTCPRHSIKHTQYSEKNSLSLYIQ